MFFLNLRCFFSMLHTYNRASRSFSHRQQQKGGMTACFQLSILSSCSFDSCHHVDLTHPRGPIGFVQLLLLRLFRARTKRVERARSIADFAIHSGPRARTTADNIGKENGPVCCLVVKGSTRWGATRTLEGAVGSEGMSRADLTRTADFTKRNIAFSFRYGVERGSTML